MYDAQITNAERINGIVERVTFHNPDNGFCVLRVRAKGHQDLVTIVGNAPSIAAGEHIECSGEWHQDKIYGQQFKASDYLKSTPPNTLEGIEMYLGSGLIKGIGAQTANILIKTFGEEIFSVLENEPNRLMELSGIGAKRKKQIIRSWAEQKSIRDIMIFLQSHGVSTARAVRIYKTYGDAAIAKVTENPYRLALDIQGIGFKAADDLALRLGRGLDSIERARAGVHHVLQELCHHGHCAAEYQHLVTASMSLLKVAEPVIKEALEKEIAAKNLVLDEIDNMSCVFPIYLHHAESESAKHLLRIGEGERPWDNIEVSDAIPLIEKQTGLTLADSQKQAIEIVLKHKLAIITGGPGVGKTTIVNSILKMIQAKCLSIALCAPTGESGQTLD